MHEFKIIQDIFPVIEDIAKDNHLRSISKVYLQVGALRQVVLEFLQFAFKTLAKDTIASNAELIVELVPVTVFCPVCQKEVAIAKNIYICPQCENGSLQILTGKEVVLTAIDGEKN